MAEIKGYSSAYKGLHWIIAVIVIGMLTGSFFLGDLPKAYQGMAFMLHKSTGLLVLSLMLIRLVWIHLSGKPDLPDSIPAWQRILSHLVHHGLYLFLILMPLSGWVMSVAANKVPKFYGLFLIDLPWIPRSKQLAGFMNNVHETIAWILIVLVVLHVAAALKHHFINKDDVLQRML